jgi:hypothetical protein
MKQFAIVVGAIFAFVFVASMVEGAYWNSPSGQIRRQEQLAQLNQQSDAFWQVIRTNDPNGNLFLHYRVTDADTGGVIWVTMTNQWFYLPAGEQEQVRDMLKCLWGRYRGDHGRGPVILVDIADRQI